jgi:diguanylate cyclase (GGDEF)-like protein
MVEPQDGAIGVLTRCFAEEVGAETAVVLSWGAGARGGRVRASWNLAPGAEQMTVGGVDDSDRARHPRGGIAAHIRPGRADPVAHTAGDRPITWSIDALVRSGGQAAGLLRAGFSHSPAVSWRRLRHVAEAYAGVVGLCLEGPGVLATLVEAPVRDGLTGCLNYGGLRAQVGDEINRCQRHGHDLACCFVDVDALHQINDERGHRAGNRVLAGIGAALRDVVRSSDLVGRHGGAGFVVALPETNQAAALVLAQRLRVAVSGAARSVLGEPVEASVGVAAWDPGCSADALFARAERALRTAKRTLARGA